MHRHPDLIMGRLASSTRNPGGICMRHACSSSHSHRQADVGDRDAGHTLEARVCVFVADGRQLRVLRERLVQGDQSLHAGADITWAVRAVMLEVAIPGGPLQHEVGEVHRGRRDLRRQEAQHAVVQQRRFSQVVGEEVQVLVRIANLQAAQHIWTCTSILMQSLDAGVHLPWRCLALHFLCRQ